MRQTVVHVAVAFAVLLAARSASAQPTTNPPTAAPAATPEKAPGEDESLYACKKLKGPVSVNFKEETELKDLISWAMGFTCKNFIYDSSIIGRARKISIISPLKMTPQEAYRVFLVSLSTMQLTVVPKGNVLRIVESASAKGETVPVLRRGTPGNADEVVRLVVRPNYLSINELSNALNVVKSGVGVISPVTEANALIVTDYSSHIRDMMTLTRELDRPMPSSGIYTIKVEYADAKELATKLTEILNLSSQPAAGGGKGGPTGGSSDVATALPAKIIADERTNSLILLSNQAGYLRVRALVKRLDVPMETEGAAGSIHVYQLENATAEEMANTLNAALSGQGQQSQQGRRGTGASTTTPNLQGGRPAAPAAAIGDLGAAFEGQVRVTHDAPTNALVVVASGRDFVALRDVIRKLDIARRQVFIEAVVLELQINNSLDIGTSFHGGVPVGDDDSGALIGGVQTGKFSSLIPSSAASLTGLIGALIGQPLAGSETLFGLGTSIPSYGVMFQALAGNSNVNLLSSPHLIASDNQESEISVGDNIPYSTGTNIATAAGAAGGLAGGLLQAPTAREKLLLTLKIKPHVNASDRVRLEIELETKEKSADSDLGPIWSERKIKTSVVVPDQQSIVIGGLMQDKYITSETKVPLLGDIPLLGYLFKQSHREKRKANLLVLLTPYVIKDHLDIEQIVERKVRERQEFLQAFSTFERMKYMPRLDYRRKRGLLEEINRAVITIEKEEELLRSFQTETGAAEGAVTYDEVPGEPEAAPSPPAGEPPPAPGAETAPPLPPKQRPMIELGPAPEADPAKEPQ